MKKKIKIVQFVEAFGGGVYTYVKDLCNFLVQNQYDRIFEIHLIYSSNRVELDKELFYKQIDSEVILHELDMRREISLKKDLEIMSRTRKLLKKIKPDILHLHSSKASVIGRIASFGVIDKKRMFYSPHGYAFLQKNISYKKVIFYKIIEYGMPALFGGITVASGNTEYEVSKRISKSILIRNGVDFDLPRKLFNPKDNSRLTIGTIGRLTLQKNPKFFNEIAERIPDVDFLWIGNGELQNEITSENITVTGWVRTREELLEKLNDIDVYLQVSLWEGLPIALIEAMAMKKPLVVSNVVGNKDCVEQGQNGYTFNTMDEAIEKLMEFKNSDQRKKYGQYSFSKAYKEYNKDKNFSDLLNLYLKNILI